MAPNIRLIVRADDAGSSWASNMGCLKACTEGIARSVEVMMPGPWVTHAAKLFNEQAEIDIGIHLTLTSEWDAVKWRPLTQARSLTDETGYFFPLLMRRDGDARACLCDAAWSIDDVARELRAQIELGVAMFQKASHVSSHMLRHVRDFDPRIGEIVAGLCDEYALKDDPFGYGLARIEGYPKIPRDAEHRTAAFIEQLSGLAPGTYIFIDHPAVESAELAATGHAGYEDVLADRMTCLQTLTSSALKERIHELGIELIRYTDL